MRLDLYIVQFREAGEADFILGTYDTTAEAEGAVMREMMVYVGRYADRVHGTNDLPMDPFKWSLKQMDNYCFDNEICYYHITKVKHKVSDDYIRECIMDYLELKFDDPYDKEATAEWNHLERIFNLEGGE